MYKYIEIKNLRDKLKKIPERSTYRFNLKNFNKLVKSFHLRENLPEWEYDNLRIHTEILITELKGLLHLAQTNLDHLREDEKKFVTKL